MKKYCPPIFLIASLLLTISIFSGCVSGGDNSAKAASADTYYLVELDEPLNGTISVEPPIPADGMVKAGTEFTLTAVPDPGYVLDSTYKMIWIIEAYNYGYFMESMESPSKMVIDPNDGRFQTYGPSNVYKLGASFIKESELADITVTQNVEYAKPGDKALFYDVFSPKGAKDLPCVVIIHGGGWAANTEDIMRGMGREIAKTGKYVVFNMDYRLLNDLNTDGTPAGNSLIDIVEDVFGAIAHIQKNAAAYGGNPDTMAVTGDSAGGHLAAVVANMSYMIGTSGFDGTNFEFWPTGVAKEDVAAVRENIMSSIKVAAPSYGVFAFAPAMAEEMPGLLPPDADESWLVQLSPITHIPDASVRALPPQQCQLGTEDPVIPAPAVESYVAALKEAGQTAEYIKVPGASHAYFDWKPDPMVKETFNTTGKEYLNKMIQFFDENL